MPLLAVVVNRTHPAPPGGGTRGSSERASLSASLRERLLEVHEDYEVLRRAEARAIGRLEVDIKEAPVLVPELETDVHDLRGLDEVARSMLHG
jgi:hypothetical protein